MTYGDANYMWMKLLDKLRIGGLIVSPRGKPTREIIGCKSTVSMAAPVISINDRKLGYHFMCAEAAWILSGDSRVESIAPYAKMIKTFSDDGVTFFGAYGPKVVMQMPYVARSLNADESTRQAIMTIWRESPMPSKDIPCTISLQWLVRESHLHCCANMRSSDAWLGVPYDWFNFSMISAYLLLYLRQMNPRVWDNIELGDLHFYAGSQHLYEENWDPVERLMNEPYAMTDYEPLDLKHFTHPQQLINHLWYSAQTLNHPATPSLFRSSFMREFI